MAEPAVQQSIPHEVTGSYLASTAVVPANQNRKAEKQELIQGTGVTTEDAKDMFFEVAETGVPFLGPAGYATVPIFSFWNADRKAQKALMDLLDNDDVRAKVGDQLGMPADQVYMQHLFIAAHHNDELRGMIQSIQDSKSRHPWANAVGVGGMAAGASLGGIAGGALIGGMTIPIIGAPLGATVGGLLGAVGGFEVGRGFGLDLLGGGDARDPLKLMGLIKEKRENGNPITTQDVFSLRVAQKHDLRDAIEQKYDIAFDRMDEETRQGVLRDPDFANEVQRCHADATACNAPDAPIDALMAGSVAVLPSQATQWTSRVAANRNAAPQSFVQQEQQRRAASVMDTDLKV